MLKIAPPLVCATPILSDAFSDCKTANATYALPDFQQLQILQPSLELVENFRLAFHEPVVELDLDGSVIQAKRTALSRIPQEAGSPSE